MMPQVALEERKVIEWVCSANDIALMLKERDRKLPKGMLDRLHELMEANQMEPMLCAAYGKTANFAVTGIYREVVFLQNRIVFRIVRGPEAAEELRRRANDRTEGSETVKELLEDKR